MKKNCGIWSDNCYIIFKLDGCLVNFVFYKILIGFIIKNKRMGFVIWLIVVVNIWFNCNVSKCVYGIMFCLWKKEYN